MCIRLTVTNFQAISFVNWLIVVFLINILNLIKEEEGNQSDDENDDSHDNVSNVETKTVIHVTSKS